MGTKSYILISGCLVLIAIILIQIHKPITNGVSSRGAGTWQASNLRVAESYGKLPLSFEANRGQADGEVKFLSRGSGYSLFLTANEAVMELNPSRDRKGAVPQPRLQDKAGPLAAARGSDQASASAVVRMKLVGANPVAQATGVDELPGKSNYFIGNDPAKWRTNVPTYAKVRYENVYSGIDLVYYGNQRQLEYDFVVSPGADPRAIRLAFPSVGSHGASFAPWARSVSNPGRDQEGAPPLCIDAQGDLVLGTERSELRLHRPIIYQEINGARKRIGGNFVISEATVNEGGREVGFEVARYDASKPLIIDPVLTYSTYLGGSSSDYGEGIVVDSSGNAYVTGYTTSTNFPAPNPLFASGGGEDAFVAKLNAAGSALVYSTYLGGSGDDFGEGIAVDSFGNAYVTGETLSTDFPTANAFQGASGGLGFNDAFVTKLNAAGSALVYSTYLGGGHDDYGKEIALDSSGDAYVTGHTGSTDFPHPNALYATYSGGLDAFVAKLNAAGSALVYSTYLGGTGPDYSAAIAVDSSGNAYVTGETLSTDFPTANAVQGTSGGLNDAFVTKLNANGSALVFSTYLGGSANEVGFGIAVDSSSNVYVAGASSSGDFPIANAFQPLNAHAGGWDAFVTKVKNDGSALVYSTYLGGGGDEYGEAITVDSSGNTYLTGYTNSTNFPTANASQSTYGGGTDDAFVTEFNAAGSGLVFSTYLGGSGFDTGKGIAVDSSGNAYVVGETLSTNFPTANAFQPAFGGGTDDAFVAKLPFEKKRRGQLVSD